MITVKELSVNIGDKTLLDKINFQVQSGEFLAILGANGAGKSTLMNCVTGQMIPSQGQILIENQPIGELNHRALAQRLSFVPQQQLISFSYPVIEMVVMGKMPFMSLFEQPKAKDYQRAMHTLQLLDIGHLAKQPYNELSGGERQLVLLARAILQSDKILLLDEPNNHLDYRNTYRIFSLVKKMTIQKKTSVVSVLHDPNLAALHADKVLMLKQGKVLAYGPTHEVMTQENISNLYNMPTKAFAMGNRSWFAPQSVLTQKQRPLMLLTGTSGSGKTTLLKKMITNAPENIVIQGVLSPGVFANGRRESFRVEDILTKESVQYGSRTPTKQHERRVASFSFSPEGEALAKKALTHQTPADLMVIDEVGPLELMGKGYAAYIPEILLREDAINLWVVRPDLLPLVQQHFDVEADEICDVNEPNAYERVCQFCFKNPGQRQS